MPSFRDLKRNARRDLHREMQVPVFFIPRLGGDPLPVSARVHTKFAALGDQAGSNAKAAEMLDRQPQIIFMTDEVPVPERGDIVSVELGEAYVIDTVGPRDDITFTAIVKPLSRVEALKLPVRDDG